MKLYKYLFLLSIPVALTVSCKKSEFVQANINPSTLTAVDPGAQFLYASAHFPSDFEHYYDYYRAIMPWMQYITGSGGNAPNFTLQSGNFNYRYGNFYGNVGLALADIPHLIEKMPAASQPGRVYQNAIASIFKAYYAFYVSDINGSIPYSQAFEARYGGTLTPVYDAQQQLFDSLDLQIKTAVTTLETSQSVTQVPYGTNDPFYGGNVTNWIKAGNALRLKIATRLLKVDAATLTSIATSVLADGNQMSSVGDSWVMLVGPSYADASGNFNPTGFLAAKPMVDFMNSKADPRLSVFYRPNSSNAYVGSPTDPDTCQLPFYQALYTASNPPFSQIQHRLWTPNFNEGSGAGTGTGFFPVITYAEYCFIRADLAARGITQDIDSVWYNKGVTASITFYDARATAAGLTAYTPLTNPAATAYLYLQVPGIAFNPAKATEQIACQAYIDFFKQPAEAWAWWKRTGFPNTTSVLAWSPLTSNGTPNVLSRRVALGTLTTADANYANQQAAFKAEAASTYWGSGPADASGRVWWDAP